MSGVQVPPPLPIYLLNFTALCGKNVRASPSFSSYRGLRRDIINKLKAAVHPVFVTLGPAGTNHELVTQKYLSFRGLKNATIKLVDDFIVGLRMMVNGQADYMIQVAVHPDCADVVATAHFKHDIHIVDTFISPSKELGIVTRKGVEIPHILALQPATRKYVNLDRWEKLVPVNSIMRIVEGLLECKYDSGLIALEMADKYPDCLRVDVRIGTFDDAWIVYGKHSVSRGNLVAARPSPIFF